MKKTVFFSFAVIILVFSLVFLGCDDGNGNNNNDDDKTEDDFVDLPLPAVKGNNDVSGKTYFVSYDKITFAANGTYVVTTVDNGNYGPNKKYTYNTQIETGKYSWDDTAKTVTLKPEKVAPNSGGSYSGSNGNETITNYYGSLSDRTAYRSALQTMLDEAKQQIGQAAFNQYLSSIGFSSATAYVNYQINRMFSNRTNTYSFSTDGNALFLGEALPANKGINEFSGQTYYGVNNGSKDDNRKYEFTSSSYTRTFYQKTTTGSYAYDSSTKRVFLRPEAIGGKNRAEYYSGLTNDEFYNYPDDDTYCAATTNRDFSIHSQPYNSTSKLIED